jgi:acyl-CoA thioester hydrolase
MSRLKIQLPEAFSFSTKIPVRITDLNYGNHVGNDAILSIIHEGRMQFLQHSGYTEMEFAGVGMIMSEVEISFRTEAFYGDEIIISIAAGDHSRIGFDLFYKLEKEVDGKKTMVAAARTGMICFDYKNKKITSLPQEVVSKWFQ